MQKRKDAENTEVPTLTLLAELTILGIQTESARSKILSRFSVPPITRKTKPEQTKEVKLF